MNTLFALLFVASPGDQLGFASSSAGVAGAAVARPRDASIAFYNPALAASAEDVHASAGYSMTSLQLSVNGAPHRLEDARATHLGFVIPVSLSDYGRLGVSFALSVPDSRIIRARILPIDRPRFLMYDNRLQRVSIDGALSYAYTIGDFEAGAAVGAAILSGISGRGASFELIERGTFKRADASIEATLPLVAAPQGALFARYGPLHAGVTLRAPLQFDIVIGTSAEIAFSGLGGDIYTAVAASDFFTPLKIAGGLSWVGDGFAVHGALEFHQWSAVTTSDLTVADIEFASWQVDLAIAESLQHELRDVFVPKVGVELDWEVGGARLTARGGAFFEMTPVVRSRILLDADRVGGALGFGVASVGPLWVLPRPLSLDLHLMMIGLLPRHYQGTGAADPRGDLEISGFVVSGGATVTARF